VLDTTEAAHDRRRERRDRTVDSTLFIGVLESRAARSSRTRVQALLAAKPTGATHPITDPDTSSARWRPSTAPAHVHQRPGDRRALLGAVDFGLLPAALAGIAVEGQCTLRGRRQNCAVTTGRETRACGWASPSGAGQLGRDKLTLVIDAPIEALGLWAEQLVAESTGKQGPRHPADRRRGARGRMRTDRTASSCTCATPTADAGHEAANRGARRAATRPYRHAHGRGDLGRLFFYSEFATAVVGWVLQINPFRSSPNVRRPRTHRRVLTAGAPAVEMVGSTSCRRPGPPALRAIMGYLPYRRRDRAGGPRSARALIERYGVATHWGYGPRFLHSTASCTRAARRSGASCSSSATTTTTRDPGEPYGFRTLISAQADGDLQTLRGHGCPPCACGLPADDVAGAISANRAAPCA